MNNDVSSNEEYERMNSEIRERIVLVKHSLFSAYYQNRCVIVILEKDGS